MKRWLVGSPLPTAQGIHERLTKTTALAVFSSDALSSVAYATQEILYALVVSGAGAAGLAMVMPISIGIATLLVIVAASYRQTIKAYPSGGGAYIVAKDNLGVLPGLIAAAALLIDYILTVAVSAAAGVNAITSAVPSLLDYRTLLCCLCVVIVSVLNLRGIRESGRIFAAPTYLFILSFGLLLIGAFARMALGHLNTIEHPAQLEATVPAVGGAITIFILMRAFAAGCTALTGVEAISNGVPAFQKPESKNAASTLTWMAIILCTYFLAASFLASRMGAYPNEAESVLSQIARTVFGVGPLYYLIQTSTALILLLAVNTSFADFPRLASILARDRFVPRQFANQGDRLVYSNGIVLLAGSAMVLLVIFKGSDHHLLPLYAVGVFLSFTLSQAGMLVHHYRLRAPHWQLGMLINGTGAVTTGVVLCVIAATKFVHGAWVVILLIPIIVLGFLKVHRHYIQLRNQLSLEGMEPAAPVTHTVVVPVAAIHRGVVQALQYARALSPDVRAVAVDLDPEQMARLRQRWPEYGCGVPLIILDSPYRSVVRPILEYIDSLDRRREGEMITVILPEFVPARWWEHLLHNQTALLIKGALLFRPRAIVVSVPYHLRKGIPKDPGN